MHIFTATKMASARQIWIIISLMTLAAPTFLAVELKAKSGEIRFVNQELNSHDGKVRLQGGGPVISQEGLDKGQTESWVTSAQGEKSACVGCGLLPDKDQHSRGSNQNEIQENGKPFRQGADTAIISFKEQTTESKSASMDDTFSESRSGSRIPSETPSGSDNVSEQYTLLANSDHLQRLAKGWKGRNKRSATKRKDRKGKKKRGQLLQALEETESKLKRRNNKIERRLTVLRKNTFDRLNKLHTEVFQHPVEIYQNKHAGSTQRPEDGTETGSVPLPNIAGINVNIFKNGRKNLNPVQTQEEKSFIDKISSLAAMARDEEKALEGTADFFHVAELDSVDTTPSSREDVAQHKSQGDPTFKEERRGKGESGREGQGRKGQGKPSSNDIKSIKSDKMSNNMGDKDTGAHGNDSSKAEWRSDQPWFRRQYDRQEERISQDLNRNYRELMLHLNGMLQKLYDGMDTLESHYMEIFNGTRYDIMNGAIEIYENLHEANVYIYDGVMSAAQFTRQVIMKAHKKRENQRTGRLQDQPEEITASRVERRDFQPQISKLYELQSKVDGDMEDAKRKKMQCKQIEARLQQVREAFHQNYDYWTVKDVFDNLNTTIVSMNNDMAHSPQLKMLARGKTYKEYLKSDVEEAKFWMRNSSEEFRAGLEKMRENYDMYKKWEKEHLYRRHRMSNGQDFQADSGQSVSPERYLELQDLVSQTKRHSYDLERKQSMVKRILSGPIAAAERAMSRQGSGDAALVELKPMIHVLKMLLRDMFSSLDDLRVYIGSTVKVTYPRRCGRQPEGSGWIDDDEEDDELCEDTGSGFGESPTFVSDDEDFVFDGEPVDSASTPLYPLKQLGLDLADFTSKLLKNSQQIYDSAQSLQRSLAGLQQRWRGLESKFFKSEEFANAQKDFILDLDDKAREFQEVKMKIREVSFKLDDVKRYDFDYMIEVADQSIKHAKARLDLDRRPPPQVTTPGRIETMTEKEKVTEKVHKPEEEKKKPEEGKEETSQEVKKEEVTEKETDKEEKKEDDFDYSALFKQGREIMSDRDDIQLLRAMAIESCGKVGSQVTHLHGNISTLRQKVANAREMLSTLQMSISKSGSGHIPVPIPNLHSAAVPSLTTSIKVCIKPKSLDGTVLVVAGNKSASYGISMSGGEMTVTAYGSDNDDLDSVTLDQALVADQWYTIDVQRTGQTMNVTAVGQDGEVQTKKVLISGLDVTQPLPLKAFVGGVPEDSEIGGGPWEGCVGELSVDGRTLSIFRKDSEGTEPTLCTDHCMSDKEKLSTVFSGGGFAHFMHSERETIDSVTLSFQTRQPMASLLSIMKRRHRFYLSVTLDNGALRVESSGLSESVVLLSESSSLNDGQSHLLKIVYRGSRSYPELDGNRAAFSAERARPQIPKDIQEGVLIGAFVSTARQYLNPQYRPLIGCLGNIAINDVRLLLPDAAEVYNTYQGRCQESSTNIWRSCWQWGENSKFLSFGEVEDSNTIKLLVSRDATGPLIHYVKEDKFDIEVSMTTDGIDVSSDDSEGVMIRPEENNSFFTLITIVDDGDDVMVKAWDQSVDISYGGFWGFANIDLTVPHVVAIGETNDGEDRTFTGSVVHFTIGDRLYDLSQFSQSHTLSSCEGPTEEIGSQPPMNNEKEMFPYEC